MINFYLILFFTLFARLAIADDVYEPEKKFIPCGLFGFRCLDKKRAQMCDEKYDVGEGLPRPRTFDCADGLVCDEEKKEFCSPADRSYSNCSTTESSFRKKKSKSFQDARVYKRVPFDFFDDDDERTTMITTTNVDEDDDEEPTEKSEVDPWNGNAPITCTSHGFYPDVNNKSLFLFCDLKKSGNGFVLRHMRCGPNRLFEANYKTCVLKGSTRSSRRDHSSDQPKVISNPEHSEFNCTKKKPGKYPDAVDCHIYHLCLPTKLFAPFQHLTVECPHSTAFDPSKKKCTKKAQKLCAKKSDINVYCEEEIRFRETRSCDRYFLCYQDQIFEFSCATGFQFDETLQFCEVEHFVACE